MQHLVGEVARAWENVLPGRVKEWETEELAVEIRYAFDGAFLSARAAQDSSEGRTIREAIRFESDEDTLTSYHRSILREKYEALVRLPCLRVRIEGHTDDVGDSVYNVALGERRGNVAMEFLMECGVSRDRLTSVSRGEDDPHIDADTSDYARTMNRRVEFEIIGESELGVVVGGETGQGCPSNQVAMMNGRTR